MSDKDAYIRQLEALNLVLRTENAALYAVLEKASSCIVAMQPAVDFVNMVRDAALKLAAEATPPPIIPVEVSEFDATIQGD